MITNKFVLLLVALLTIPAVCMASADTTNADGALLVLPSADTWSGGALTNMDGNAIRLLGMYYTGGDFWNPDGARLTLSPVVTYEPAAEGEGEAPAEGEGELPAEGEGEVPAEGEGEVPAEGEGEVPAEGEGEVPAEGEGEMPVEGEGEMPAEGEGEVPAEGEGEVPVEGEGEVPAEGEGEVPAEGEGEVPAEGEGEVPAEGEGEEDACGCGCNKSQSIPEGIKRQLGDFLLLGVAVVSLFSIQSTRGSL